MLRKLFPILAIGFSISYAIAQEVEFEAPDYEMIRQQVSDTKSDYPKLLTRFQDGDTTLYDFEIRTLYYGYIFQKDFKANWVSKDRKRINDIFENEGELSMKELDEVVRFTSAALKEFPFSTTDLKYLGYAHYQKGDTIQSLKCLSKIDMILSVILTSGDGRSKESAWHIISPEHEYALLNAMGFDIKDQSLTSDQFDYIRVSENPYETKGFYFNVKNLLNKPSK